MKTNLYCFKFDKKQLKGRVTKLEALLSAAQDEIEDRDEAIQELNNAYEVILFRN